MHVSSAVREERVRERAGRTCNPLPCWQSTDRRAAPARGLGAVTVVVQVAGSHTPRHHHAMPRAAT